MSAVLRFEGVRKSYRTEFTRRRREILHGIDFEVASGETFAYLGHNGAGKTTSIKALLGLIAVDAGTIEVFGRPPGHRAALARIGYVPENPYFYDHLSGREFLELVADLHRLGRREARRRIGEILELVDMADRADRRMRTYSKGMLQRIAVGQALVNDPELLVLDEPMGGLDPMGRHHIRTIVDELKVRGKTIFMSSHILADVEAVADRAAILSDGHLRRIVDLDDRAIGERAMVVHCRDLPAATREQIHAAGFGVDTTNDSARIEVDDRDRLAEVVRIVQASGAILLRVAPRSVGLEEIFLREVRRKESQAQPRPGEDTREDIRRILDGLVGSRRAQSSGPVTALEDQESVEVPV